MENLKLTAQIAAAYWGCKVKIGDNEESRTPTFLGNNSLSVGKNKNGVECWYKLSHCQLLLTPLSSISDEDAIEVAKIIKPELSEPEYRLVSIYRGANEGDDVHGDILNIEYEHYCKHPDINNWLKSCRIQIDVVDFDVVYQYWVTDKMKFKDDIPDNIVNVIDYLRSKSYDCGYGSIPSLLTAGIAINNEVKK